MDPIPRPPWDSAPPAGGAAGGPHVLSGGGEAAIPKEHTGIPAGITAVGAYGAASSDPTGRALDDA